MIADWVWLLIFGALLIVLVPAVCYLLSGWVEQRQQVCDMLNRDALNLYFQRFARTHCPKEGEDPQEVFLKVFDERYGRHHFIPPLILLTVVAGLGLWAVGGRVAFEVATSERAAHNSATPLLRVAAPTVSDTALARAAAALVPAQTASLKKEKDRPPQGHFPLPLGPVIPPFAAMAFMGAWSWVAWDQMQRFRRNDFTEHDVNACALRLLFAVPAAIAVAAITEPKLALAVAFALGAFPTGTINKFLRRFAGTKLGFADTESDGPTEVAQLQGAGKAIAERFEQEGVTTIAQLAWADPVDLTVRTNYDFNFVVDCVSQSLLWVYFGTDTPKMYKCGLRGAQETCEILETSESVDVDLAIPKAEANGAMEGAATVLGLDAKVFRSTLRQVANDPYSVFLYSTWGQEPDATPVRRKVYSRNRRAERKAAAAPADPADDVGPGAF